MFTMPNTRLYQSRRPSSSLKVLVHDGLNPFGLSCLPQRSRILFAYQNERIVSAVPMEDQSRSLRRSFSLGSCFSRRVSSIPDAWIHTMDCKCEPTINCWTTKQIQYQDSRVHVSINSCRTPLDVVRRRSWYSVDRGRRRIRVQKRILHSHRSRPHYPTKQCETCKSPTNIASAKNLFGVTAQLHSGFGTYSWPPYIAA